MTTTEEQPTEGTEEEQPHDDAGRTYSADEMRAVREEAGTRRTQLRAAEAERDRYLDALRQLAVKDAVSGLLADPTDLAWSDDYADDESIEWTVSDPHHGDDMPTDIVPAVTEEFADESADDVVAGDDSATDQLSLRHGDTGDSASGGLLSAHRVDDTSSAPAEDWSNMPAARPARGRHSRGD